MGILFIIAWPLSKILDCLLGKDHSTFYRRAQLKVLVDLHGPDTHGADEKETESRVGGEKEHLSIDEVLIIKVGVL